jgi:hypothetical protein
MGQDEEFTGFDGLGLLLGVVGVFAVLAMVGYALWHLWAVVAG